MKNYILLFSVSIENLKKSKISHILEKALILSIFCSKWKNEYEKVFKEEESTDISKVFGLVENI